MNFRFKSLCLTVLLTVVTSLAQAQAPAANPPAAANAASAVAASPDVTTATYGDWLLRCRTQENVKAKICEVIQSLQAQGQTTPFAHFGFTKADKPQEARFVAILPINVTFSSSVLLKGNEKDQTGYELTWLRCIPSGCVAQGMMKESDVAKLNALTEKGVVVFKDAAGRNTQLPISFRGLAQAYEGLKSAK